MITDLDKNNAIRSAAKNGHVEIVKLLLKDPSVKPEYKAIIEATENGNIQVVELFLKDARTTPKDFQCAFRVAVGNGNIQLTKMLLHCVNPGGQATFNSNFIDIAVENDKLEMVEFLLTDKRTHQKYTHILNDLVWVGPGCNVYKYIIRKNSTVGIKLLLENNPTNKLDVFYIDYAIRLGKTEIVKLLLEDSRTVLHGETNDWIKYAFNHNYMEIVKSLITNHKVNLNDGNNHLIQYFAEHGCTEIIKLLLTDPRVDPCANNNYPIRVASEKGHVDTVKLLLTNPKVNPCHAIKNCHSKVIKLLTEHSDDCAMLVASVNGDIDTVKSLVQDGVDPCIMDNYAIKMACRNGHTEVVKMLLGDSRVTIDNYAFQGAVENGHTNIVRMLLAYST